MHYSRSSSPEVFCKKGVLRNFVKFTGKRLCQSLFLNKVSGLRPATLLEKRLWHRCFPVNNFEFCDNFEFLDQIFSKRVLLVESKKKDYNHRIQHIPSTPDSEYHLPEKMFIFRPDLLKKGWEMLKWQILFCSSLRPATLLKRRHWHRCFPVNFMKYLTTPFFTEHLRWLLLLF